MKFIILSLCVLMGLSDCSDPGVAGDLPPPEIFCNLLVGCDTFPQDKVCGLAIDGCWSAYTFDNDCQLSLYNCEHPSTPFYKYWDGACYPEEEMITISPIEREPFITISPIETEPMVTISPIEREPIVVYRSPKNLRSRSRSAYRKFFQLYRKQNRKQ